MKPRLSICRTCHEPLPLGSFRRHNDEMRTRHDSCSECEDKAKALKALKRPKATVRKDRYNAARYAARVGKVVGPVEVKTRWVGSTPHCPVAKPSEPNDQLCRRRQRR